MNHSATVLQEQEARLCPLARRWHCIAAARVGLGHRSALLQSTSLHFKAEGKLHCRKISAGNAATSGGGRGQTERGSEDNLPFRRERGGKVVPKPHPSKARLPSQTSKARRPQLSPQRVCCTCSEAAPIEVKEETSTTQFLGCPSPWRGEKTKL